jgi:glycosyltransferase involved in cell wall biosynthesis
LSLLGRAKVAVLLPCETEGCYLPALEAMAMGALVVCPDCVGNRTFCRDGDNSFRPDYAIQAIEQAVLRACSLSEHDHERMVSRGVKQAQSRSLSVERRLFLDILEHVPSLV